MSKKIDTSTTGKERVEKGWQPINEGYQPQRPAPGSAGIDPTKVNGGYQPSTNKAPSDLQPVPPPAE